MRILVTGFEPFGTFPTNPSQTVALTVAPPAGVDLMRLVLPVVANESVARLMQVVEEARPAAVLTWGWRLDAAPLPSNGWPSTSMISPWLTTLETCGGIRRLCLTGRQHCGRRSPSVRWKPRSTRMNFRSKFRIQPEPISATTSFTLGCTLSANGVFRAGLALSISHRRLIWKPVVCHSPGNCTL